MFRQKGADKPATRKLGEQASNDFEAKLEICFALTADLRNGYLANVKSTSYIDPTTGGELAAILLYFLEQSGRWTKAIYVYQPYFYLLCADEVIKEIIFYLNKQYEQTIASVDIVKKEDLSLINHLSGKTSTFLKLSFKNVTDLMTVRSELFPLIKKNQANKQNTDAYEGWYNQGDLAGSYGNKQSQYLSKILDIREYDVPYHIRVQIDKEIRCGKWYEVKLESNLCVDLRELGQQEMRDKAMKIKADLRIMAFDIETTKSPLKFPDSSFDQIMMISYIIDDQGFLITNREVVGEDVQNFEYAPRADYDVGVFTVFNERDEECLLRKFFAHICETKPSIFTTFNGDKFDWPFIQTRAEFHKISMEQEIGITTQQRFGSEEFSGRFASHMDCMYWVERDAYLPQGSHGLKAVTKAKLGYDPVELDPELMVPYAREHPQELAEYSVSDSVATYFLYKIQIHDFIFALCNIIPTNPDEVLRRGSGTLCEDLLMAQAYRGNIIFPNKQIENLEQYHNGKLIDTQTYIGGHVECLRVGVYRSDIPVKFKLEKAGYQDLIDKVPKIMDFALEIEGNVSREDVENYEEVRAKIVGQLEALRDQCPTVMLEPLIYHVDVAAMYPNIILSNRLQPVAIVNDNICAGCLFNKEENDCKRKLDWQWKGEVFPLNKNEFAMVKARLEQEEEVQQAEKKSGTGLDLNAKQETHADKLKSRIKMYCSNSYKKLHKTEIELRTDTVCMRENPFYVDTVRDFRDRRYKFKTDVKVWGEKLKAAKAAGNKDDEEDCKNMVTLSESLQLAHKIILNSFYGYVMRRGARWYSMEMAAMVTHTGGNIIMDTRSLFDQIGMPLELDTDGIWTLLPKGFPEHYSFQLKNGKKANLEFPCTMCNLLIYDKYANPQYQTLVDKDKLTYEKRLEMSVFFEIDGPYKAFIIPASKEEHKMLKKRYAVFNKAGKMTEIKGFELKRRGELNIIKIFQGEVFSKFLEGNTLQECYDACGDVAKRWYDILESKGEYVNDSELIDYIGECRVMSKRLAEYGSKKSTSITCASRLADFLGKDIVKDKGLNVKFIISKKPETKKVAERAIPTAIFETDDSVMKKFVRKWCEDNQMTDFNIRQILDWDYYKQRLASNILKIVMIPAAKQNCLNPVPAIEYPDWLRDQIKKQNETYKQKELKFFFKTADIEDITRARAAVQPRAIQAAPVAEKKPELNMVNCPTPEENFGSWLKHQKSNWRNIRQKMKEEKKNLHTYGSVFAKNPVGMQANLLKNFMHNMDETVLNSNWHVIQIDSTYEPGILKLWAMTEQGLMFNVKVNVPKKFYINYKKEYKDPDFKRVLRAVLPRNRKVHNLYEWENNEEVFLNVYKNIKNKHLLTPDVEGLYETKLPAKFRALIELSAIVRPIKRLIPSGQQAISRVYKLQELENVMPEMQYMPAERYQRIYIGHSHNGNRHFWGIFTQANKEAQFFVVNPANVNKAQGVQNLETLVENKLTELGRLDQYADWHVTGQHHFKELHQAIKAMEQKMQDVKLKNKQATIVILHSDLSPQELQLKGLQSLVNDFPVLRCPVIAKDNDFNPLQWIPTACKNMTERFTDVEEWVESQVNTSRYSLIPLCNLGEDNISIIDTLYSRSLHKNKHLLWYSDTSLPDLGGNEDRNCRIQIQEEIENPELNKPGFYRTYVVEIELGNLALNTIFQSEFLKEFEDAGIAQAQQQQQDGQKTALNDFDTDLDEFVTCKASFQKLKELCGMWLLDVERSTDVYADGLLSNLYRWLTSSTKAKMYDPLLHRLVQKLMKKCFYKLLYELKQLGCIVIHGNFQRLFVKTNKRDLEEAMTHINFVTKTINENPLFRYINLTPNEFWKILLFKDYYNFAGIKESNPETVAFRYDVCLHLPEAVQHKFKLTICEFILKVHQFNLKHKDMLAADESELIEADKIKDFMDTAEGFEKEFDYVYISKLIQEYFCQKLLSLVDRFSNYKVNAFDTDVSEGEDAEDQEDSEEANQRDQARLRKQAEVAKWEFPQRISSYNTYQVPALEFVKMICNHAFGLDDSFQIATAALKRNLLTQLHKKEFSTEVTQGIEPSLIFVIPDVICDHCQTATDLDICRAHSLNAGPVDDVDDQAEAWQCTNCHESLNKVSIERRLIDLLNRRMVSYQMQDLRCKSCKMVSNQLVSSTCACTGNFEQTLGMIAPDKLKNQNLLNPMTDIRLFVRLLRNFGNNHQLHMLRDTADTLLNMMK